MRNAPPIAPPTRAGVPATIQAKIGNGIIPPIVWMPQKASAIQLQSPPADVLRLRANQMIFRVLLDHVGAPACHAAAGEQSHELAGLEAERLEHQRGVELH